MRDVQPGPIGTKNEDPPPTRSEVGAMIGRAIFEHVPNARAGAWHRHKSEVLSERVVFVAQASRLHSWGQSKLELQPGRLRYNVTGMQPGRLRYNGFDHHD